MGLMQINGENSHGVFFVYIFYQICDFTAFYDILLGKYGKLGKTHEILVSQNYWKRLKSQPDQS